MSDLALTGMNTTSTLREVVGRATGGRSQSSGVFGKYAKADVVDHAAGRPYVRDRHRAPYAHPTVRSLLGASADLPEGLASASLRAPSRMGAANVLRERNPQLSAIGDGGWEKITLIVDSGASDTVMPPRVCRAAEIRHSCKVGTEFEVADGGVAKNLREKLRRMTRPASRLRSKWLTRSARRF